MKCSKLLELFRILMEVLIIQLFVTWEKGWLVLFYACIYCAYLWVKCQVINITLDTDGVLRNISALGHHFIDKSGIHFLLFFCEGLVAYSYVTCKEIVWSCLELCIDFIFDILLTKSWHLCLLSCFHLFEASYGSFRDLACP